MITTTTYMHYQQHNMSIKLVADRQTDRLTDRHTDIATYKTAITARNMTTECSDIIKYNNSNNNYALKQHKTSTKTSQH